ncbi:MAG: type II toxin-antitoxin system VapC family toxin [Planctomycetota bacterium]|nr:type II toxin-antitoxin system VapC family toxin [Planctomycetota bacterium]
MKFILDTNTCVFVIRQKSQILMQRFAQYAFNDLGVSSVTLAELRFGAARVPIPPKIKNALNAFLAPLAIADFDARAAELYGDLRTHLERRGTPIGPLDTMIAAHALSLGIPIITNNIGEFSRVPALAVQDWTQP